jgi:hypothetical protein
MGQKVVEMFSLTHLIQGFLEADNLTKRRKHEFFRRLDQPSEGSETSTHSI